MKTSYKGFTMGAVMAMTSVFALAAVAQDAALTKSNIRAQIGAAVDSGTYVAAEIKFAPGQVKVETITPEGLKIETIYAVAEDGSLLLLKRETEAAEAEDMDRAGSIEVRSVTEDFLDEDDDDDDDDDSGDDDDDEMDDDDHSGSGHDDDDDDSDDDNSGSGSDDDDSDDDNSGSGSDDDSDDDNSGSDDDNDDD